MVHWRCRLKDEAAENEVVEDLQPPLNVKELLICHYRSIKFPNFNIHQN
jgi:hypothetical protein